MTMMATYLGQTTHRHRNSCLTAYSPAQPE